MNKIKNMMKIFGIKSGQIILNYVILKVKTFHIQLLINIISSEKYQHVLNEFMLAQEERIYHHVIIIF